MMLEPGNTGSSPDEADSRNLQLAQVIDRSLTTRITNHGPRSRESGYTGSSRGEADSQSANDSNH